MESTKESKERNESKWQKLELIKNLQQTLKEIKNARAKLDEDIELFRNNSSKGEFFSESLGEKIKEQLEGILKLQKDFSEKYSEIDENCEGTQICILEEKLSALQKKEEKKSKYREAVRFFMNLSSENADVVKILGKKKRFREGKNRRIRQRNA